MGRTQKMLVAFYIRKSQGDTVGMAEYAKRIRKIQAEMGINPTNFDSNILDENTALLIDQSYRKAPTELNGIQDGEQPTIESDEMDYEQIMARPRPPIAGIGLLHDKRFLLHTCHGTIRVHLLPISPTLMLTRLQMMKTHITLVHQNRRTRVKRTLKRLKQFIKNNAKHPLRTRTILQFPLP